MTVTIWHNPRCTKSRDTLALLEADGHAPDVRLYLKDPPSEDELRAVLDMLDMRADEFIRKGEQAYRDMALDGDAPEELLIAAMSAEPKLIERPVVIANGKARIGRPPNAVLDLFNGSVDQAIAASLDG